MITPIFLNEIAEQMNDIISSTAIVTVGGVDVTVQLQRSPVVDNVVGFYFLLDNTQSGKVTNITLTNSNGDPLIIETPVITKTLGSIYVGTFRITVEEDL